MPNLKLNQIKQFFYGLLFLASFLTLTLLIVKIPFPLTMLDAVFSNFNLIFKIFGIIVSSIILICLIYYYFSNRDKRNKAKLIETKHILSLKYNLRYWKKFKRKEFLRTTLIYIFKVALIWVPIIICLKYSYKLELRIFVIFLLFVVIFTIPIIPFTLGKFIGKIRNQLFEKTYVVKIYRSGLKINESYYPYNQYINKDYNILLLKLEIIKFHNIDCLNFESKKTKFHYHFEGPGEYISIKQSILIPVPQNTNIDLEEIIKQLKIKPNNNNT